MKSLSSKGLLLGCVFVCWGRIGAIENSKGKDSSTNNIGQFVGQLTSLINQGAGGYQGTPVGYQSGGFPGQPYPPYPGRPLPPPGVPYPPYPGQYPPGPPRPPPYQQFPSGYPGAGLVPSPTSVIGALSSIARYDDLRCVPRLLCEVASGARPGGGYSGYPSYSQESPVPFLSKDAFVTLLTVLNFVDDSPLLVFGRAALLGYTARGDSRACLVAYPTCPRDPDQLVDYLNNHNGGFFRFFNQQLQQYAPQYQQYQPQPYPPPPGYPRPYPPPYSPYPRPYPPPFPLYSPQRPLRPRPGYPQQYSSQHQRYQSRIQTQPESVLEFNHYAASTPSPIAQEINHLSASTTNYQDHQYYQDYYYIRDNKSRFVFPEDIGQLGYHRPQGFRGGKKLFFPTEGSQEASSQYISNHLLQENRIPMVFPDRTGTGDLRLDLDEYGNYKTVHYESLLHKYRDQRQVQQVQFPKEHHKMQFPLH